MTLPFHRVWYICIGHPSWTRAFFGGQNFCEIVYLIKCQDKYILVLIENGLLTWMNILLAKKKKETWMNILKFCVTSDIFVFSHFSLQYKLLFLFILAKFVEENIFVFRNFYYISLLCSCCELWAFDLISLVFFIFNKRNL